MNEHIDPMALANMTAQEREKLWGKGLQNSEKERNMEANDRYGRGERSKVVWILEDITPLPWSLDSKGRIIAADGRRVAHRSRANHLTDFEYIVQACNAFPALLEAAKIGLRVSEAWINDELSGTDLFDDALAQLEPIRKAIAKAEGQP
jgi:hypothetical protein